MGILDGIVEWIAEQVMNVLDLITTSVLGALGCSMDTFVHYFPAAESMYHIFVATGMGLVLLNWVWQLFKNFGAAAGSEAEDPFKLSMEERILSLVKNQTLSTAELILCTENGISKLKDNNSLMDSLYADEETDCNSIITECRVSETRFGVLTAIANLYLKQRITFQIV